MTASPVRGRRTPIGFIAVAVAFIHQVIAIPLLAYEMPRGKANLSPDVGAYLFSALQWPWFLLPTATPQNPTPLLLEWPAVIIDWLLGPISWAALICVVVWLRRKATHAQDAVT